MLIFYSDDLIVTGYQTFPETSDAPHIVADDSLAEVIAPAIGKLTLTESLRLPEDIAAAVAVPVDQQITEIRQQVSDTIDSMLDAKAVELGYLSFLRAGLYLTSPVQKYKDEAQSLTAWAARMYEYVEALEQSLTADELLGYDLNTLEFPAYEPVAES